MKSAISYKILLFLLISLLFSNCASKMEVIPEEIEINDFVWKGLNAYYFWQSSKPDLADTRFNSQATLNNYLAGFSNSENIFESLLL